MSAQLKAGIAIWVGGALLLGGLFAALASDPNGRFGGDWNEYRIASLRMVDGGSPYAPEMLRGPVAAQGTGRYRYPPPFAQLVTPIAILPASAGAALWAIIQAALIFATVWYATRAAGARSSMERFVWAGVAATLFLPVFATVWTGNAEAPLVLAVGALLAIDGNRPARSASDLLTGAAAGTAMVVKLTPLALLPPIVRRGGLGWVSTVLTIGILVLASVLLAPGAWSDYARVLPNLLAGDVRYANNLAPAVVAVNVGAPAIVADSLRVLTLGTALIGGAAAVLLARRRRAWPAAVGCAVVAGLLVPGVLWYHYLVVLLPLAVFAWIGSGRAVRQWLVVSGAGVSLGLALPPLAALAGASLAASILVGLWPRRLRRGFVEVGLEAQVFTS